MSVRLPDKCDSHKTYRNDVGKQNDRAQPTPWKGAIPKAHGRMPVGTAN